MPGTAQSNEHVLRKIFHLEGRGAQPLEAAHDIRELPLEGAETCLVERRDLGRMRRNKAQIAHDTRPGTIAAMRSRLSEKARTLHAFPNQNATFERFATTMRACRQLPK